MTKVLSGACGRFRALLLSLSELVRDEERDVSSSGGALSERRAAARLTNGIRSSNSASSDAGGGRARRLLTAGRVLDLLVSTSDGVHARLGAEGDCSRRDCCSRREALGTVRCGIARLGGAASVTDCPLCRGTGGCAAGASASIACVATRSLGGMRGSTRVSASAARRVATRSLGGMRDSTRTRVVASPGDAAGSLLCSRGGTTGSASTSGDLAGPLPLSPRRNSSLVTTPSESASSARKSSVARSGTGARSDDLAPRQLDAVESCGSVVCSVSSTAHWFLPPRSRLVRTLVGFADSLMYRASAALSLAMPRVRWPPTPYTRSHERAWLEGVAIRVF